MFFNDIEEFEQDRVRELEERITQARHDYYNGQATVTDEVYDAWVDELAELKEDSPAVTAVGASPASAWPKVEHSIPMGSLDKVQTMDEMTAWVNTASRPGRTKEELLVTEKLDGISISVRYEKGKLLQALTRGDGEIGEDITPNVARMKGVLKTLPQPITVTCRGEIVLHRDDHQKYFPDKANPRNAASGTAKRLDGKGCEHLTVYFYQALDGPEFEKETEQFEFLVGLGLKTPRWYLSAMSPGIKTPHDLWVDYQTSIRESLPYEIDGLVVRLQDLAYQWSLGEKNGRPRGATAFKFAAISRETIATARVDQVGGTGRITPVAEFKPIRILGAEISRASLYNQSYVEQIGFGVGARIMVSRANDVIPRVVSVSGVAAEVSKAPETCPECGAKTERDGEYIICPNTGGCPAQTEGRIKAWIREQGIMEWGPTLINKVVTTCGIKTIPDLYRLTASDLQELERMGETSSEKAIDELFKVLPLPLENWFGGLSIPLCATSTMRAIVDAGYETLEAIRTISEEDLLSIPGVGPKRAKALRAWLDTNQGFLDDMLKADISIKAKVKGALTGKSVCFTGKSEHKRAELETMVKDAGGTVKKSVGKGLSYLVMADPNSNSTKAKAARKNNTECISEDDFLKLVGHDD
jgi:DNA ligase (NAD+)